MMRIANLLRISFVMAIIVAAGVAGNSKPANAFFYCCCTCINYAYVPCCGISDTQTYIQDGFSDLRDYITNDLYNNNARNDFRDLAQQLTAAWMLQAQMIGGFYDAQAHSAAMLELQKLAAQAVTTYTPSEAVCQFATLTRSLAASDMKAREAQIVLSEIGLSRHLGTFNNIAAAGRGRDMENRLRLYTSLFCDTMESGEALTAFCNVPPPDSLLQSQDINYTRLVDSAETIDIDLTSPGATANEKSIVMLAHNLYGHNQIIQRMDDDALETAEAQNLLPLIRSIDAKRSVAQNSFNAVTALKSTGTAGSRTYVRQVLQNLGMPAGDIDRFMASQGATPGPAMTLNPSYSAQMEILTKKIYQDPAFYVNLMETPANVDRQTASMEGLELMQGRDIFNSMSRSEMLLSVLVEMEAIKLQTFVQNNMTNQ